MTASQQAQPSAPQQWPKVEQALRAVLPRHGCSPEEGAEIIQRFRGVFLRYPDAIFGMDISTMSPAGTALIVSMWVRGIFAGQQFQAALAELPAIEEVPTAAPAPGEAPFDNPGKFDG